MISSRMLAITVIAAALIVVSLLVGIVTMTKAKDESLALQKSDKPLSHDFVVNVTDSVPITEIQK